MSSQNRRLRVAVVFGGRSSEHAISCVSAGSLLAALDHEQWDVLPIGVSRSGRWTIVADDPAALAIVDGALPEVAEDGPAVVLSADPSAAGTFVPVAGGSVEAPAPVDVVFPVLHGPYGEDGTLQGLLELSGLPYVGSGVLASAAAMDKAAMKVMLTDAGLPVGPYVVLPPAGAGEAAEVDLVRDALSLPVFVKPARAGSSVGITKVGDWAELPAALVEARRHDPKVVVEEGLVGREVECGVLADPDGGFRASVPAEIRIVGDHEFYDFEAKYLDSATELDVPAELPAAVADRIGELAIEAFTALGCEGLARVDFFVLDDGSVVVNEVNTMPGFTPSSMFPRMWAASGIDYPELVDLLLRAALARPSGLR